VNIYKRGKGPFDEEIIKITVVDEREGASL